MDIKMQIKFIFSESGKVGAVQRKLLEGRCTLQVIPRFRRGRAYSFEGEWVSIHERFAVVQYSMQINRVLFKTSQRLHITNSNHQEALFSQPMSRLIDRKLIGNIGYRFDKKCNTQGGYI